MDRCPCPDCATGRGEPDSEIDLRWRNWAAVVTAGGDYKAAFDRFLHPESRIPADQLGGQR